MIADRQIILIEIFSMSLIWEAGNHA